MKYGPYCMDHTEWYHLRLYKFLYNGLHSNFDAATKKLLANFMVVPLNFQKEFQNIEFNLLMKFNLFSWVQNLIHAI